MTHAGGAAGAEAPRSIILDMDVGVDDAIALIYLAGHPEIEVAAVGSVHGNVEAPLAGENARRVLELVGLDEVPVAVGCWRPMAQPLATAGWVHGEDGLGNTNQPPPRRGPTGEHAVDQLIRLAHERPGAYDLLATGPLTNLGTALLMDRDLPRLIRQVTIMGGSADGVGNATPNGEANIWHDPEAADLVFNAGWPITMVGLDVTMATRLEEPELETIAASNMPQARFATAILDHYLGIYETGLARRICPLHDPLSAGVALDPSLVTGDLLTDVHVSKEGPTRGMTIADRRPKYAGPAGREGLPLTRVALRVDSSRFVRDLVHVLTTPLPRAAAAA